MIGKIHRLDTLMWLLREIRQKTSHGATSRAFTYQIPGIVINESELKITFPSGAMIRLYSGENYERMRGIYLDGVILDEPADIPPGAWATVIRPCLSDYQGWAWFIGTPKGKNAFYKRHLQADQSEDWFSLIIKASESGILPEDELKDIKGDITVSEDDYLQEYECDFTVGRPGAIYAADMARSISNGMVADFPVDDSCMVHTTWDLGAPENTVVIYWQKVGLTTRIIDCDFGLKMKTGERVAHMRDKGYNYGVHLLPHDGTKLDSDNMSFSDRLKEAGLTNVMTMPRGPLGADDKRILAMSDMFSQIWFHEKVNVEGGLIEALESYHRKEHRLGGYVENQIVHDWSSHFCFAADTEVLTDMGIFPISELPSSSRILTVTGWEHHTGGRVTKRNQKVVEVTLDTGRKVVCTPDHKWLTESGWKSAESLTENTLLQKSSATKCLSSMGGYLNSIEASVITHRGEKDCIKRFGGLCSERFRVIARFITSTITETITGLKTLSALIVENTNGRTLSISLNRGRLNHQVRRHSGGLLCGINPQRELNGIGNMRRKWALGKISYDSQPCANTAEMISKGLNEQGESRNIAHMSAKTEQVRVVSVRELPGKIDVWCITVPVSGHFSLADGVIVKNCDAFGYWSEALKNRMVPELSAFQTSGPSIRRATVKVGGL
jgi:phage terminase large subunit